MSEEQVHLLLVEDNPGDAGLLRELLAGTEAAGLQLAWVETLSDAIAKVESDGIDVILLDLILPDSAGLATVRRMYASAGGAAVVVMSGVDDENTAIRALREGAEDYLIKGRVDSEALLRSIRYAVGRSQSRRALLRAYAELEDRVRERTDELLKTNQALLEKDYFLQSLLDNLSTVIFVKDLEGRYIQVNPAFERLFDLKHDDIIGKTDFDLVGGTAAEAFRVADREAIQADRPIEFEENVPCAAGARTFMTIKAPLRDAAGVPYAMIGLAADITERKLLEQQLRHSQKMEAVGRLAGGVAHDFNNLLSIIVGYTELLGTTLKDHPLQMDQLAQISKAAEQAASLTRKLLTFSRRQMTKHKAMDLNTVLRDLENMVRSVVCENVELVLDLDREPCPIRAERDLIEQALVNLALNARDAMPHGGKFTLSTRLVDVDESFARLHHPLASGPHVLLSVADSGCGMDAETRAHIFEPFFTTKEQGKGTGLGLAIVYGTVQQSGGAIVVESEPGQGTTFQIYLPRAKGAPVAAKKAATAPARPGSETILVVEDEEGIRLLLSEVLRLNGYTVLAAGNGREALKLAGSYEGPIHLMITDLVMPHMGGRELAEAMSSRRPDTRVLFISGYSERTVMPLPEGLDLLDKPFTPDTVIRKLRQLLDSPKRRTSRA